MMEAHDTPCDYSLDNSVTSGSSPKQMPDTEGVITQDDGLIIQLMGEASPWESDEDSSTSTPDFKRGRYMSEAGNTEACTALDEQARQEILHEGMIFPVSRWIKDRLPSILLLADSQVKNWPKHDCICTLEYHNSRSLKWWTQAIRTGELRVNCHTVVLYLETTQHWCPR